MLVLLLLACGAIEATTLSECIDQTLKEDPAIAQAVHTYKAAQYTHSGSWGHFLPHLKTGGTHFWRQDTGTSIQTNTSTAKIEVTQKIIDLSKSSKLAITDNQRKKAEISLEQTTQNTMVSVSENYLHLLELISQKETIQSHIRSLMKEEKKANIGLKEGLYTKRDVLAIRANIAAAKAQLVSTTQEITDSAHALSRLINAPIKNISILKDQPNLTSLPQKPTGKKATPSALQIAHLDQMITENQTSQTTRKLYPTLEASGSRQYFSDSPHTYHLSLNAQFSLNTTSIHDALAAKEKSIAARWQFIEKDRTSSEEQDKLIRQQASLKEHFNAQLNAYKAQLAAFQTEEKSYHNQLTSVIDYLQSKDQLNRAKDSLHSSFYKAWLAHFRLLAFQNRLAVTDFQPLNALLKTSVRIHTS